MWISSQNEYRSAYRCIHFNSAMIYMSVFVYVYAIKISYYDTFLCFNRATGYRHGFPQTRLYAVAGFSDR